MKLPNIFIKGAIALPVIFLLAGCGGDTAVSTLSFPLGTAYKTIIADGWSKGFTVAGDCSGSGNRTVGPASTPATFEGVTGLSAVTTFTMTLTNCTPAITNQTFTSYYDSSYVPLGIDSPGVNYGVYATPPTLPTTVKVGDTGPIGTMNLYTDSTKSIPNGTLVQSYVIEPNNSATAIVNLVSKNYDQSGTLVSTEQSRSRIDSAGTLTPVSTDIQYANVSTTHLILTYY